MINRQKNDNRGFAAIATVILVVSILLGLVVTVSQRSSLTAGSSSYSYNQLRAGYAADAGLKYALRRLADVPQWTSGAGGDDVSRATLDAKEGLHFSVLVSDWRSSPNNPPTVDGYTLKSGEAYIRTMGECQLQSSRGAKTFRISRAYIASPGLPDFQYGVVADQSLEVLDGSVIDGYTSSPVTPPPWPMWVGQYSPFPKWNQFLDNGHCHCNSNAQKVYLSNASVRGKLSFQSGNAPRTQGVCSYSTGAASQADVPYHRPPFSPSTIPLPTSVPYPAEFPVPADGNIVVPDGATWALVPGSYRSLTVGNKARVFLDLEKTGLNQFYFTDFIKINGGSLSLARYNTDETAEIYIGGDLECAGGWINPEGRPSQVAVMFVGDGKAKTKSQLLLSGTAQTWMVASGGNLEFKMTGQSHLFGGVKAKKATIGPASAVHYDVALRKGGIQGLIEWRSRQVSAICPSIEMAMAGLPPSQPPTNISPPNATLVGPAPAVPVPSFVPGPTVTSGQPAPPYTPSVSPLVMTTAGLRRLLDDTQDPNIFQSVPATPQSFLPAIPTPPNTATIQIDPWAPPAPPPTTGSASTGTTTGASTSGTTAGTTTAGTGTSGTTTAGTTTGGTSGTTTSGTATTGTTTSGTATTGTATSGTTTAGTATTGTTTTGGTGTAGTTAGTGTGTAGTGGGGGGGYTPIDEIGKGYI